MDVSIKHFSASFRQITTYNSNCMQIITTYKTKSDNHFNAHDKEEKHETTYQPITQLWKTIKITLDKNCYFL